MKKRERENAPSVFSEIVKLFLGFALLLCSAIEANASSNQILQQTERSISGVVSDENGEPVIGATVVVKGTSVGTTTDVDGNFTLRISSNAKILHISYVGMSPVEVAITDNSLYNIVMKTDVVLMEDLVVIGYGTRSKKDVSIAVSSVKSDELNERPSAFNLMESIAGKVAGVSNISMSGRPGGASSLRVRGMGSINAGKDPIYVLDGVIGVDPNIINTANIESIDILKDAAATAMYGAQGSNGVVLITTKKRYKR